MASKTKMIIQDKELITTARKLKINVNDLVMEMIDLIKENKIMFKIVRNSLKEKAKLKSDEEQGIKG